MTKAWQQWWQLAFSSFADTCLYLVNNLLPLCSNRGQYGMGKYERRTGLYRHWICLCKGEQRPLFFLFSWVRWELIHRTSIKNRISLLHYLLCVNLEVVVDGESFLLFLTGSCFTSFGGNQIWFEMKKMPILKRMMKTILLSNSVSSFNLKC